MVHYVQSVEFGRKATKKNGCKIKLKRRKNNQISQSVKSTVYLEIKLQFILFNFIYYVHTFKNLKMSTYIEQDSSEDHVYIFS